MVLPDTPPQPAPTPRRGKAPLAAGGLLLVLVAVFALGQLTTPPPPEATPSTLTTIFSQPTTTALYTLVGEPFEWQLLASYDDQIPVSILEFNGEVLLFTAQRQDDPMRPQATGLTVTNLADPSGTENVAIDDNVVIHQIVESPDGLLAIGQDWDSFLGSAWTSSNGYDWTRLELPVDEGVTPSLSSVAVAGDTTIITGSQSPSIWMQDEINRELTARFGDLMTYWFLTDEVSISVQGVLGLPLSSVSLEDLGIEFVEAEEWTSTVWTSHDGSDWTATPHPDISHIAQPTTGPDGRVWAWLYDRNGRGSVQSTADGVVWEESVVHIPFEPATSWESGAFVASMGGSGSGPSVEFRSTTDFETWEPRVSPPFLGGTPEWTLEALAGADRGLAAVAYRYQWSARGEAPSPVLLERDGYTLEVDYEWVTLSQGDLIYYRVGTHGPVEEPSPLRFNPEDRTVTFMSDGHDLVTFSIDELEEAELALSGVFEGGSFTAQLLIFSASDDDWVIQDISDLTDGNWVGEVVIIGDRIFLTVGGDQGIVGPGGGARVWVADLP